MPVSCTFNGVDLVVNGVGRYCLNGVLGLGCKFEFVGKCGCQRCFACIQGHGHRVPTLKWVWGANLNLLGKVNANVVLCANKDTGTVSLHRRT